MRSRRPEADERNKVDVAKRIAELEEDIQAYKRDNPPLIKVLRIEDLPDPTKVNEGAIVRIIGENKYKGYMFAINPQKTGWDGINYLRFTEFPYVPE